MRALVLLLLLAGCQYLGLKPAAKPAAAPPPATAPLGALTPEVLDTTTLDDRAAAAAPSAEGQALGKVVVSLGAPAEAGFWLETPLVAAPRPGRVVLPGSGAAVKVELRPAAQGSGSRLSLAAMRLLGVSLTDLPEVEVFGL